MAAHGDWGRGGRERGQGAGVSTETLKLHRFWLQRTPHSLPCRAASPWAPGLREASPEVAP